MLVLKLIAGNKTNTGRKIRLLWGDAGNMPTNKVTIMPKNSLTLLDGWENITIRHPHKRKYKSKHGN
jgi:hypothetical protein